jgi:dTMP kinase
MTTTHSRGYFIVFEGVDSSGKSTQARECAEARGALFTREPGGSELGVTIRQLCLGDAHDPSPMAELLLLEADRAEHVTKIIRPALERGGVVICDRYTHSTEAYQGAGRGIDSDTITTLNTIASQGVAPDLIIVLDVSDEVRVARAAARGTLDRMEKVDSAFSARVRASYLVQAASDPAAVLVDGNGSLEEVRERVLAIIDERLAAAGL